MGRDVQTVRYRTVPGLRPVVGEDIVDAAAKQQIEAAAPCLGDGLSPGGASMRYRLSAMRVVAVFVPSAGRLDHAVQRDVFDDPDLSHFEFHSVRCSACQISDAHECRLTIELTGGPFGPSDASNWLTFELSRERYAGASWL